VRRNGCGFDGMIVIPRQSKLGDGRVLFACEGDELVDGPVGARHRSIIKPGLRGVSLMMGYGESGLMFC